MQNSLIAQCSSGDTLFVNTPSICIGQNIVLTGSGSGMGNFSYTWSTNDGSPGTIVSMNNAAGFASETNTFTPTTIGTITYSVGIYDSTAVTSCNKSIMVTVNPVDTTEQSATICANQMYSFNGQNLTTAGIYLDTMMSTVTGCDSIIRLTLGVNPVDTTEQSVTICANQMHSFNGQNLNTSGVYLDTMTSVVTSCDSILRLTLVVNPNPSVMINGVTNGSSSTCSGTLDTLEASAGFSSYLWNNGLTDSIIVVNIGTYSVIVTDGNGCQAVDTFTVNSSTTTLTPTVANDTICPNTTTGSLTVTGGPFNTIMWSNGANSVATISPVAAGSYAVTVTDGSGCSAVATGMVVAEPDPNATLGNIQLCPGTTTTLDAGAWPGFTYNWSTGAITQTISGVGAGNYSVTVTNNSSCTTVGMATVTEVNNPSIIISAGTTVLCTNPTSNASTTLTATTGTGPYTWNGPGVTNVIANSITINAAGIYTVTDASGCGGRGTINIVNGQPNAVLTATPNPVCQGQAVTFSLSNFSSGSTHELYINGSLWMSSTSTPFWNITTVPNNATAHVVTTNSFGCVGSSNTVGPIMVDAFNPVLTSSPSSPICANTSVNYIAGSGPSSGFVSGSSYEFFVNGISQGVQSSNIFSPTNVNNGDIVAVNIIQPNGCSGMANSLQMTVNPPLVVTLTSSTNSNCSGTAATFTANDNSGLSGVTYQFFLNGTLQSSTGNTYTSSSLITGDQLHVVATTPGINGCTATSNNITITANTVSPTIVTNTGSTTFCSSDIVSFIASGGTSYEFLINGQTQGVSASNVLTTNALPAGTYPVSVIVFDGNGCSNTASMNITVTAAPSITLSQSATTICAGNPVTFSATGVSSYQFFINGVNMQGPSATNSFTTTMLTAGDIVTVLAASTGSCSPTLTFNQVTVTNGTSSGVISGDNSLCQGSITQLTNNSTISNGTWLSSNNAIATVSNSGVVTAVAPGTANITYTVTSGTCISTTPPFPVFVSASGSLTIGSSDTDNAICLGETVTLSAGAGTGATYTWTASTGGTLPNTASITVSPTVTTTYTLSSTGGSCTGTSTITITVNSIPTAGTIAGGTPGGANLCEGAALTLSPTVSGGGTVVWSSSNPTVATINPTTGAVIASNVLTSLPASTTITYTVTQNGCTATSPAYLITVTDCSGTPANSVCLQAKVLLEGPFDASTQLMNDALRLLPSANATVLPTITGTSSPFPLTEPYSALPNFTHMGGGGGETTTPAVLAVNGTDAIVDWVFMELRDAANPANVLVTRSALLQRDGDIVDATDGTSPVCLTAGNNNYYLSVRHRNHLGIRTMNPISLTSGVASLVDMSTTVSGTPGYMAVHGTSPVDTMGNRIVMWGGDASSNGIVTFNAGAFLSDRDAVFFEIFLDPDNSTASYNHIRKGYFNGDTNLDGEVKYQGPNNDLDRLMFFNVLFYPNTIGIAQIINQQLP